MPLFQWGNPPAAVGVRRISPGSTLSQAEYRAEICSLEEQSEPFDRFLEWIGSDASLVGQLFREVVEQVPAPLQLLEDEGLIASESDQGKRVYRLTDAGRRELERLDEEVQHIWRKGQTLGRLARDVGSRRSRRRRMRKCWFVVEIFVNANVRGTYGAAAS